MPLNQITVERTIAAPAHQIFTLLADAGRHREFDGSGTVRGTRAPSRPLRLGTVFGMAMHAKVGYRTRNTVIEYEQDRLIAWQTVGLKGLIGGRAWRYQLTEVPEGTLVAETWDISADKQRVLLRRTKMPQIARRSMERTLRRLADITEN
jgi:uncharacterized protein YndB with AHSA1/START domain